MSPSSSVWTRLATGSSLIGKRSIVSPERAREPLGRLAQRLPLVEERLVRVMWTARSRSPMVMNSATPKSAASSRAVGRRSVSPRGGTAGRREAPRPSRYPAAPSSSDACRPRFPTTSRGRGSHHPETAAYRRPARRRAHRARCRRPCWRRPWSPPARTRQRRRPTASAAFRCPGEEGYHTHNSRARLLNRFRPIRGRDPRQTGGGRTRSNAGLTFSRIRRFAWSAGTNREDSRAENHDRGLESRPHASSRVSHAGEPILTINYV